MCLVGTNSKCDFGVRRDSSSSVEEKTRGFNSIILCSSEFKSEEIHNFRLQTLTSGYKSNRKKDN